MMGGSEEAQARRLECQKQMDGGEQSAAMFRLLLAGWLAGWLAAVWWGAG